MRDVGVNDCPGLAVLASVRLLLALREEADMMAFANHDDSNRWLDLFIDTGLCNERQLGARNNRRQRTYAGGGVVLRS